MRNRKGISLIEIILSIAIIGLIAVTILGVFDMSLINIIRAGKRTDNVLDVKEKLDGAILYPSKIGLEPEDEPPEIIVSISEPENITITLPGVGEKTVTGKIIESKKIDDRGNEIVLRTFITE